MKTIGETLRRARELHQRSLEDLALSIRIDRKFLEEIEEGIHPNLPPTYVRAFIRDYAKEVGLDPSELLKELEVSDPSQGEQSKPYIKTEVKTDYSKQSNPFSKSKQSGKSPKQQFQVLLAISLIVVAGFVVILVWLRKEPSSSKINEISFSDVIKENELKHSGSVSLSDSISSGMRAGGKGAVRDSLYLEGIASESVWVRVVADGIHASESTLPPFYKKQWRAKKTFLLSLGNAAAISFTLNNQKIGTLGVTKRAMKNVPLSLETLEQLKKKSSP